MMASSSASADQNSGQPSEHEHVTGLKVGEFNQAVPGTALLLKYNFFKILEVPDKVQCNVCSTKKMLTYKDGSTSGLIKYLASAHKAEHEIYTLR